MVYRVLHGLLSGDLSQPLSISIGSLEQIVKMRCLAQQLFLEAICQQCSTIKCKYRKKSSLFVKYQQSI